MAKTPENRFRNAQQMLGALNQLAEATRQKTSAPVATEKNRKSTSKHTWLIPTLLSLAGAGLISFGLITWLGKSEDQTSVNAAAEKNDFFAAEKHESIDSPAKPAAAAAATAAIPKNPQTKKVVTAMTTTVMTK